MKKRYALKNLDCAHCAATIETKLSKMNTVHTVSVNFATATMNLETDHIDQVIDTIRKIEPGIQVEDVTEGEDNFHARRELILMFTALSIFVLGWFFTGPLQAGIFFTAYVLSGWKVVYAALRNIIRGKVFDENFLMTIATAGAFAIREYPEAAGVMIFYQIGEYFQDLSVSRSRKSIKALLESQPDTAWVKQGDELKSVSPKEVEIGSRIVVKPGEKIPLDGVVESGESQVDTSALTGESVPRIVDPGAEVAAGMINKTGVLTVQVTKDYSDSSIAHILELVQHSLEKKAKTEKFITRFAKTYTPVVVGLALLVALLPPFFITGATFSEWLYRALILLVISCPCALVVSIPLSYFGGIGSASRKGILIKGSNYLDVLNRVKTVVFDKTGTLTKGVFKVLAVMPEQGYSENELLSLAAHAESHSNHPVAQSIVKAYGRNNLPDPDAYEELPGFGVTAAVEGRSILVGNDRLLHEKNIEHHEKVCDIPGTVVHVVDEGTYAGYIMIGDEVKEGSAAAVAALKKAGVKNVHMLTGDSRHSAEQIGRIVKIDSMGTDLLPEEKVTALEDIMRDRGKNDLVAFVGDGINDAPVIAQADVGIAMGVGGTDAAIDIADVVLMNESPGKVAEAIEIAGKTRKVVWQNIIFAFAVKLVFVILGIAGVANMWEAVFADVGVALLAVLNASRVR